MPKRVTVVPHAASWARDFAREASRLHERLGDNAREIHHIGSTAVPGIHAKPIIDILVVVKSLSTLDDAADEMRRAGYEPRGEFGIPGRRYFRRSDPEGRRTHHVHAYEIGHAAAPQHLAFRDYLRAHPETAREYSDLKRSLAAAHPEDIQAYMDGKDAFIRSVNESASRWRASP